MFINQGISVGAWVNLDSSCSVEKDVYGGELQIEFGSRTGSLGMVITRDMVDRLVAVLAEAVARFRQLDEDAEGEHQNAA
ncbi:hypothetical protein [Actinoalloteichus caeruleus]|uniref:hypothetical protein n=1 Tax=Actinoalloteichus cyanogriseus TaxID=2893586 RepID=UPI003AAF49EA